MLALWRTRDDRVRRGAMLAVAAVAAALIAGTAMVPPRDAEAALAMLALIFSHATVPDPPAPAAAFPVAYYAVQLLMQSMAVAVFWLCARRGASSSAPWIVPPLYGIAAAATLILARRVAQAAFGSGMRASETLVFVNEAVPFFVSFLMLCSGSLLLGQLYWHRGCRT